MTTGGQISIGIIGVPRGKGQVAAITAAGNRVRLAGCYDPNPAAMDAFAAANGGLAKFSNFEEAVAG